MSIKSAAQIMADLDAAHFEQMSGELLKDLNPADLRRAVLDLLRELQGSQQRKEVWGKADRLRVMLHLENYVG